MSQPSARIESESGMAERIRSFDWASTPLGPMERWPANLRTAVRIALASRFGMGVLWGPERVQIYNDDYVPIFAQKHPLSLGQRARDCWTDIWDQIDPLFTSVEQTGQAVFITNQLFPMAKRGRPEECYFTFSYSPLFGDSGEVEGIFVTALETTEGVLAERRQHALQQMAQVPVEECSLEEALQNTIRPLAADLSDLPFSAIYVRDEDSQQARRVFAHGLEFPGQLQLGPGATSELAASSELAAPIAEVLATHRPLRHQMEQGGREVLLLPLCNPERKERCAVFVAGISAMLPWDSAYEYFLQRAGEYLAATLNRANALDRLERERLAVVRESERRMKESEQRYRTLFESSPLPMWLYDRKTLRFLEVNEAAIQTYGYSREEFAAMTLYDLRPVEEFPSLEASLARTTDRRSAGEVFTHRYKDGSLHPVEISSHALQLAGEKVQLVIANDITERVTAATRLKEAHRLTTALVRHAPLAIFTCDRQLRVTSWNPCAEQLFGWSEAEVLGRPIPVFPPDEQARAEAAIEREFTTGKAVSSWEVQRQRKDGTILHVLLSTALLKDDRGVPDGRVSFIVDLSERRLLEEQFRQAQKMEAVGQLAGGIAHDFNNLLAVILVNLRLTARELPPNSEELECVADAESAAERAAQLTRQLLSFSRRHTEEGEPLRVDEVVQNAERMLRRLIRSDIQLVTELRADGAHVRADEGHLEQVLVNLVVNARDAMPSGGVLSVLTCVRKVQEQSGTVRSGSYVQIEVKDTGVGMDAATRQRIFEPFFTTKPVGKGTGLGLATVYGFVQQWGGTITVDSTPGAGTTFAILLPLVSAVEAQEEEDVGEALGGSTEEEGPRGSETILLVEDDPMVLGAVRRQLERSGYRVLAAVDGMEALQVYEKAPEEIALVLSDVVMPHIGGRELAERLRQHSPHLRILLMSAWDRDGVESGIDGMKGIDLRKPFRPRTLLQRLRETLDAPTTAAPVTDRERPE